MRRSKGDSRGSFSVRRSSRLMLVALAVSAAGLLLASAQALALSQRGHEWHAAFGSAGSGAGQFSSPTGVAIDESSGDVYVADRGNGRIERFGPEGNYIESFTATKLKAPTWIAVDNSHLGNPGEDPSAGDVYVVEGEQIDKFSSAGTFIRKLKFEETREKEFGTIMGIAVDSHGQVWLDGSEGKIATLTDEGKNKLVGEPIESGVEPLRPGFAVDSHDNVFVDYEPAERFEELQGEAPCQQAPCYTAKLAGEEGPGGEPEAGERLVGRVDPDNASAVAVQLSNDNVYVDNLTSVTAVDSSGAPIQRFGEEHGEKHLTSATGIAVNGQSGAVYVADTGANVVDIFTLEPPGQPVINGVSATKLTASSAELHGQVDPTGSPTTVEFQYGTSSCSSGGCTEHLPVPGNVGAGFADEPVSIAATGLQAGTEYHFQVLATNGFGTTTSAEGVFTTSPAVRTFSLPDNRAWEQVSPPAKNGAGIEAQSLTGGVIEASAQDTSPAITYIATGPDEPHAEGNLSPEFSQLFSTRVTNGQGGKEWSSQDITTSTEKAPGVFVGKPPEYQFFAPEDLSQSIVNPHSGEPPLEQQASERTVYLRNDVTCAPPPSSCFRPLVTAANVPPGTKIDSGPEGLAFLAATPNLTDAVLSDIVPLTSEPAAAGGNLYEWATSGALQLVNVLPTAEGGGPASNPNLGADNKNVRHALSDDGKRVIWTTGLASGSEGAESLYMRDTEKHETLRLDVGEHGPEKAAAAFQAASADGSKAFFTDQNAFAAGSRATTESPDLYVCEIVEQAEKPACELHDLSIDTNPNGEGAGVQGVVDVSEDGSTVYFVANGVLTAAANEKGEKATPGGCALGEGRSGATCNLYVEHFNAEAHSWEAPTFIATLSNADEPDWLATSGNLVEHTTRVSPNGRFYTFMSSRSLTHYNNLDSVNGEPDEEVYIYDSSSGKLVCASCNPSGARPTGVHDVSESGEGLGLLVDRPQTWLETEQSGVDTWLSGSLPGWTAVEDFKSLYQSRYLSDSGRLFFNSAESLVPADENGKEDVYQYEPQGVGSCTSEGGCVALISKGTSDKESAFLDASATGNNVYFLTAAQLVGSDRDSNFDVYDARVCEPEACITSTPPRERSVCTSESDCKGASTVAPAFGAPASETTSGAGNLTPQTVVLGTKTTTPPKKPTRAQLLAKALKSCKKLKQKKRRVACEKSARKRYGAKKASKSAKRPSHAASNAARAKR